MDALAWIVIGGLSMSAIALVGGVTLLLPPATLARWVSPLVAFAAGSLLGGAFFHMIPSAALATPDLGRLFAWVLLGFSAFLALDQLLHWHRCRSGGVGARQPFAALILLGDALHNFLCGVGVAGAFLIDVRVGVMAWLAAAAHEVPQELGDFAVLLRGGFGRREALVANFLSALTFLAGGLIAYAASSAFRLEGLLPFAAGTFLYIGAADLVPDIVEHRTMSSALLHFLAFAAGVGVLALLRIGVEA